MVCGFSMGATTATIVAIRRPGAVRALVNDAGFDFFNPNPQAPTYAICRQLLGGSPGATRPDPEAAERFLLEHGMGDFLDRMKRDHDGAQGPGAWRSLVVSLWDALKGPCGHTFEDMRKITAPTLVLTGDRDMCCSVEDAVTAYRMLSKGQLAILPNEGHSVPDAAIRETVDFLRKCAG
jgi:pimeloyl-ACP methyl ester carboxylesterase